MANFLSQVFGSKPSLPKKPKDISLAAQQQESIAANVAAEPAAKQFSGLVADQIDAMIRRTVPNFDQLVSQATSNISDELGGNLPLSDQKQRELKSLSKSFGGGYGGSGMGGNLVARDLGLTEVALTDKGLSSAESWLRATESLYNPALVEYTRAFITPEQQYASTKVNRDTAFQYDWLKSQINAMPDPRVGGVIDLLSGQGAIKTIYGGGGGMQQNPSVNKSAGDVTGIGGGDVGWNTPDIYSQEVNVPWDMGGGAAAGAAGAGAGAAVEGTAFDTLFAGAMV